MVDYLDNYSRMFYVLWMIGYCVEFPRRMITRIGGHGDWNRRVMYKALKMGYVQEYKRNVHKRVLSSLRLTPDGMEYLACVNPDAVDLIFARNDEIPASARGSPDRILRLHSLATATIMALGAGVQCFPADKPSLMSAASILHNDVPIDQNKAYYYSPREIRRAIEEKDEEAVTKGSRMLGVIVKGKDVFFFYDTGRSRMYWREAAEQNAALATESVLITRGFTISGRHQIMLGANMDVAIRLMAQDTPFSRGRFFTLSDFFQSTYFLTNDTNGDRLLQFILDEQLATPINKAAVKGCHPPAFPTHEYDAVLAEGERPLTVNYRCDLQRIRLFNFSPAGFRQAPVLRCFDYQVPTIQRLLGANVEVQAIEEVIDSEE